MLHQALRHLFLISLLCGGLCIACTGPRGTVISRRQAMEWHEPLELRIIRIMDGFYHARDPHLSHLLEVEIQAAPEGSQLRSGDRITLPYDEWMTGSEPPARGSIVVTSPAAWVRRNRSSGRQE